MVARMSGLTSDLPAFLETMARVPSRVEAALREVAATSAGRVQRSAKARVPKGPERKTEQAIVVVEEAEKRQFRVQVNDVPGRNPMVPVWLEFGTSKMGARPFMGPALDEIRSTYTRDGEQAVANILNEGS